MHSNIFGINFNPFDGLENRISENVTNEFTPFSDRFTFKSEPGHKSYPAEYVDGTREGASYPVGTTLDVCLLGNQDMSEIFYNQLIGKDRTIEGQEFTTSLLNVKRKIQAKDALNAEKLLGVLKSLYGEDTTAVIDPDDKSDEYWPLTYLNNGVMQMDVEITHVDTNSPVSILTKYKIHATHAGLGLINPQAVIGILGYSESSLDLKLPQKDDFPDALGSANYDELRKYALITVDRYSFNRESAPSPDQHNNMDRWNFSYLVPLDVLFNTLNQK
jgi:hypothetical protein